VLTFGTGAAVARAVDGRTVLARARADSPLRFLRPTFPGARSAALCIVTFGGGLVDGDAIELELEVEAGATLLVFTQSSTKVFRGASRQALRAKVDGRLILLPDPVAAFAGASYTQRVDVELGPSGSCVVLDGFTSGRAAYGERWAMTSLDLRTTVTQGGRAIVTDALQLQQSIETRAGGFDAFATLIAVGQGARPAVEAIKGPVPLPTRDLVVAASPLPRATDGAILRVAAATPSLALEAVRARLGNLPEMDAVDPFASRY
jgi:urease accessory protein